MSYSQQLNWETLRSIDAAELTGGYDALGDPLANPSYILKLVNDSTVTVTVSIDGTTDIDVCPSNSFWLYDETKFGTPTYTFAPAGTQFFVNGMMGGTGNIYLVTQFIVVK